MTQSDELTTKTLPTEPQSAVRSVMLTSYADLIYSAFNHYER